MPLILDTASARPDDNFAVIECAHLIYVPDFRSTKRSAIVAIADSLAGRSDSGEAARCATETLRKSHYAAPPEWELTRSFKEGFGAAHHAVANQGEKNRAATLSAIAFQNRTWAFGHLGDNRIWLYRDGRLKQLTRDHTERRMGAGAVVTQACGLGTEIEPDISTGELQEQDIFLITTKSIHDVLNGSLIMGCIMKGETAQEIADGLLKQAVASGGRGNLNVCVVCVDKLPGENEKQTAGISDAVSALPIGPLPKPGTEVDGFQIQELIHKGASTVMYKAIDKRTGQRLALRFPNPDYADDREFIDAFLREEWIGKQSDNQHLLKVKSTGSGKRSFLYSTMEYCNGELLSARIKRKKGLTVRETIYLANQLLDCLEYLHSKGIIHRDIHPGNIFVDKEHKRILLVGFDLSSIEKLQDSGASSPKDTQFNSYRAPELLQNHVSDKRSDIYSIGVTVYKMLTGKYPYGRVQSVTNESFKRFTPPEKFNDRVPEWLSDVIKKACSPEPEDRYETARAFATALNIPVESTTKKNKAGPIVLKVKPQAWPWLIGIGVATALASALYFYLAK